MNICIFFLPQGFSTRGTYIVKAESTTKRIYMSLVAEKKITFTPEDMVIMRKFQLDQNIMSLLIPWFYIDHDHDADGNTTAKNDTSRANNDTSRANNNNNTSTSENYTSRKGDLNKKITSISDDYWRRIGMNYNLFGTGKAKQILAKLRPDLVPKEKGVDWSLTSLGDVRVRGEESPFVVGDVKESKDYCSTCVISGDGLCYCEANCEYIIHLFQYF